MKKLVCTLTVGVGLVASSYAQGFFAFDNTALYTGSSPGVVTIGTQGHAGEGAHGATVGSDLSFATPNYDLGYAWILGTFAAGNPTTAAGVTISPQAFSMSSVTGDDVGGAGLVAAGAGAIPSATVGDGSVVQMEILAWYDPNGTTTFQQAYAAGYNVGWSTPISIRLIAGLDTSSQDISAMTPFTVNPVPEPSTFALAGLGAAALLIFRRRK